MEEIIPARLSRDADGHIYAADFKDYYHSKLDAPAESCYVFLQGNQLPDRWCGQKSFVITELGFGTSLNFLTTWHKWLQTASSTACLHYLAIEKHPLQAADLSTLLQQWPEFVSFSAELLLRYPPLLSGIHRLELAGGRIQLTLCFMDAATALEEIVADVDCWYLDGFSPAGNPDMWSEKLLGQLAAVSKPGATLATFTAAGAVRRGLQAAGFTVQKRKGFGRKREMLTAVYTGTQAAPLQSLQPWHSLPKAVAAQSGQRRVIIVGGGIAGCQSARALAERGWSVTLLERHQQLAQEASGNRAGVLIPKMTANPGWGERFYRQAFLYTHRQLCRLQETHKDLQWSACGAMQLNHNEREAKRWQALAERNLPDTFIQLPDTEQAGAIAGITLPFGGSYFPLGGWINPRSFCEVLLRHENIRVRLDTTALKLQQDGQQWQVQTEGNDFGLADAVVLANGKDATQFTDQIALPFMPVRGQTSAAAATPVTAALKTTLGHEGYVTPQVNGAHIFGATFERDNENVSLSVQSDQQNFTQLQRYLPAFAAQLEGISSSHAAVRMTTPDRFPYVGAVPDSDFYLTQYADLRHGKFNRVYPEAGYISGLYIAAGFGSRGLTTSGLCAALLAGLMDGEPLAVEKSLYSRVHPSRFLIRRIRQNRR